MTKRPPYTDLPGLLAWLNDLPPPARVPLARLLADRATGRAVAELADATVYEMTRTATMPAVAEELGATVRSVRRAVATHMERTGAEPKQPHRRVAELEPEPPVD